MARNDVSGFWLLSTRVALIGSILTATFLLHTMTFDLETSSIKKAGIFTIFFAFLLVSLYNFKQALKNLKFYERIFEENQTSSFIPNSKSKETCTLRKKLEGLKENFKVRRFSHPATIVKYKYVQHNGNYGTTNKHADGNRQKIKTERGITGSKKPNEASNKIYDEIPAILHNCVKDSVIQCTKSLSLPVIKTYEGTSVLNKNSTTGSQNVNLNSEIAEEKKDILLLNTECPKEIFATIKCTSNLPELHHHDLSSKESTKCSKISATKPLVNSLEARQLRNEVVCCIHEDSSKEAVSQEIKLDNHIGEEYLRLESSEYLNEVSGTIESRIKSFNLAVIKTYEDTSVFNKKSTTGSQKVNFNSEIDEEKKDILLLNTECPKEISGTINYTSDLPESHHHDLSSTESKKCSEMSATRPLVNSLEARLLQNEVVRCIHEDSSKEAVSQEIKLDNRIGEEDLRLDSLECLKEVSGTIKSRTKSLNLAVIKTCEDTSILNKNSTTGSQKMNFNSEIAEEKKDILLLNAECPKEISVTIKCTSNLPESHHHDLSSKESKKFSEMSATRPLVNSLAARRLRNEVVRCIHEDSSKEAVSQEIKSKLYSQIGEEDLRLDNSEYLKEVSATIESRIKSFNLAVIKTNEDTSVFNKKSTTGSQKVNFNSEIAEEKKDILLLNAECPKEISGTINYTSNLPETNHRDLSSKESTKCSGMSTARPLANSLAAGMLRNEVIRRMHEDSSKETVTQEIKSKLDNRIGEEDLRLESPECLKKVSGTIKSTTSLPQSHQRNGFKEEFTKCSKSVAKNTVVQSVTASPLQNDVISLVPELSAKQALFQRLSLHSQIGEEEENLRLRIEAILNMKNTTGTTRSTRSLPLSHNRDFSSKEKPTNCSKEIPAIPLSHCLRLSLLQNDGTRDIPESSAKQFLRKSSSFVYKECPFCSMIIPKHQQEFRCKACFKSDVCVYINLYETKAVVRRKTKQMVSFKKRIPKVPMRSYVMKDPVIQYSETQREIARKGYIYSIFTRESRISKNETRVSKDTRITSNILPRISTEESADSVDEMLLSIKQSLSTVMADPSLLANEIIISKFEKSDSKKSIDILNELDDYW